MHIHLSGGKTAPRLLQDLYVYDPRKQPSTGFNILAQIPFHDEEKEQLPLSVGRGSCKHQWSIKSNQCSLPENGYEADFTTLWIIAAYCAVCRSHLELSLDIREGNNDSIPCPTKDRPLHHFVHRPELSKSRQPGTALPQQYDGFAWVDTQVFQCSCFGCPAKLTIRFKPPRLLSEWVSQLTDQMTIKNRAGKAIASDPARFEGHSVPQPIEVLYNTRTYIYNAMYEHEKSGKKIKSENKKWMLNLGDSCVDMLEYIGFTCEAGGWMPPHPEVSSKAPFTNAINIRLDDIQKELQVLMSRRPDDEKRAIKFQFIPEWATKDLRSAFRCLNYQQSRRSRTIDLTKEEHPFYAGLGAVEDFHDDLIVFAYDCQRRSDLENTAYYLECLQGIAEGRASENLQTKVAIEASSDIISFRDVRAAYKELGLDSRVKYEDETILGTFHSRIADAPKQEVELRRALRVVGQNRSSQQIQVIASQTVTNYEQALALFDIQSHVSDEFILAIYSLKVGETPSDEPTARHAISLIATHRNSNALKQFLETGTIGEVKMDTEMAHGMLDILDPTIDDQTVLVAYQLHVDDEPHRLDSFQEALAAIAKSRNSSFFNNHLGNGVQIPEQAIPEHALSKWPVGIENVGNTCYLNSLLQFLFTIKPLRDLVLDIESFKMPIDEANFKSKQVGPGMVSKDEIERAQRFGDELCKFFRSMIYSPNRTVRPDPMLVYLTLVSCKEEEDIRKESLLKASGPTHDRSEGKSVQDASAPPSQADQADQRDIEMSDEVETEFNAKKTVNDGGHGGGDSASPPTLRGDEDVGMLDTEEGSQSRGRENKENLPPSLSSEGSSPDVPIGDSCPSGANEQSGPPKSGKETQEVSIDLAVGTGAATGQESSVIYDTLDTAPPPERPPPIPPRPQDDKTELLRQAETRLTKQHDVTEKMGAVLDQLQYAIKAEDVDEDTGAQIDTVKRLFYNKQKEYSIDTGGAIRCTQEVYQSDIKVNAKFGSIHAALDDAIYRPEESQYTTISQLPPVLQILVGRTGYKRETNTSFKIENHLKLEEKIYMDRYMDFSEKTDLAERHRKIWGWKKKIENLEDRKLKVTTSPHEGKTMPDVFRDALEELKAISELENDEPIKAPPEIIKKIKEQVTKFDEQLEAYNSEIEDLKACISREFDDLQDLPYRLQSVFIHGGGGPNSGHYWVYIYDFAEKLWRVYNDGRVEEANYADVFPHDTPNSSATSYFLVYVKDDKKDELVNCVKRDPVQDEAQENPDTPMENRNDAAQPTQEYGGRDFNQESVRGGWYSDTAPAPRGEKW